MNNTEFANFLRNAKWYDQARFVSHEELSEEQQKMVLKQNDDVSLHAELAKNPTLTPKVQVFIARLRDSDHTEARWNLADNNAICEKAQEWLAEDPDEVVRSVLAFNSSLSTKIARKISLTEKSLEVLLGLSANIPKENWADEIHNTLKENKAFMRYLESMEIEDA